MKGGYMVKKKKNKELTYKPLRKIIGTMRENNIIQEELAERLNMSISTLNQKLNGNADFKLTELRKIAEILEIPEEKYFEYFFAS